MKLLSIHDYPMNRVELKWHGPYRWNKETNTPDADWDLMSERGVYRAESSSSKRELIKYIGSASESFRQRLNGSHRIRRELVEGGPRRVRIFLATLHPERSIKLTKKHIVEIEYILQNAHWHDLISWHGLGKLPKTSRGQGWHLVNRGQKGHLHRVVAYPAFAISGQDRD